MKKNLISLAIFALSILTFSQIDNVKETIYSRNKMSKVVVFVDDAKTPRLSDATSLIRKHFNLSKNDALELKSSNIDDLADRYN